MATRFTRKFAGTLKGRLYSGQAKASPSEAGVHLPKQTPKVTKLPNGIVVASLENYSPVSHVSVVVNAGSRFETGDNLGVTHCLRAAAGLSTQHSSEFKINRSVQQTGGNLSCTSTREYLYYTVDCTRDHLQEVIPFLKDITTSPLFKPWELSDLQPKLALDIAIVNSQPQVKMYELLHQAAFRNTLGRSVYAPEFMVGKYSPEQLMHYVKNYFTGGRMALIGTGVDHDDLVAQAKTFTPFASAGAPSEPAAYHGGEIREHTANPLTYAAVAVEGPSFAAKDLLHVWVLQHVMGTGPYVKYSPNTAVSKLGQAVSKSAVQPFAVSCLNATYTDGGLFGFSAVAQPNEIGQVLRAAFNQFAATTKGGITDQEVARAKNQLKMSILMDMESQEAMVTSLAEQVMGHEQVTPVEEITKMIDAITTADVVNVAKKMINGKPSMAAVGDLSNTPYLDELYK